VYLTRGRCDYNNTQCWTHPGTYISEYGFILNQHNVHLISDTHARGMKVFVDGQYISGTEENKKVDLDNGAYIHVQSYDQVTIQSKTFRISVVNSDLFFNTQFTLLDAELLTLGSPRIQLKSYASANSTATYPAVPIHGLIGQTWKNAVYENGHYYEGHIDDYVLPSRDIFGTDFVFTNY